jgi:cellulose synthase/poly-beta-1,6-N-acetylglucosamine synthase-like glycosyltransferase
LALPRAQARARRFDFGPAVDETGPLSSIIIPFYGDAFFLNCAYHLQRVLGPGFELILVVDDPRIWPEVYGRLSGRHASITVPTVLLQCAQNYGYARANNLGASAARGDVLFLMNSDVMVLDPTGLIEAADAIRARHQTGTPDTIIGFSLLFEDDTIQHIGMEFPRSPLVGGMRLADHPMKGLPIGLYDGEATRSAPAVTGAMMALAASLYQKLGGFDATYERGDFEDADLCLRAQEIGAEIRVHVRPGLYHLEGQSIRTMGDAGLREMITYLNCVEFNARWDAHLSQQAKGQNQVSKGPVAGRGAISVRKRNPAAAAGGYSLA